MIKNVKKAHQIQDSGEFQVIIKPTGTKTRTYFIYNLKLIILNTRRIIGFT